ncbi:PD40 domain-containing protein [Nocardioides plantarum]|uniref:PD40 domain-containing protein n=1 Tax=Nocardioides plantarum TaxID=29299 RepID=A0ABV5K3Y5_9ACTN|nr:PD40 domain-containing protein [Nocardioides plantarum]
MTGDGLRDELARIAGDAPVASVSPETWGRAQRARARDRVVRVLGAAAAVAVVAGLAMTVLPHQDEPPIAGGGEGLGVPDRLYAVPDRMSERDDDYRWRSEEITDDVTIGRGAAAWVTYEGLPVVVDAEHGDYHLLDLPGFVGNDLKVRPYGGGLDLRLGLTLSPDGRRLAYAYGDPGPWSDDTKAVTGVRVLDLTTGDVRDIALTGGEGTVAEQIRFSPDGRWLVWAGRQLVPRTGGSLTVGSRVLGRIAPGATQSTPVSGFRPSLSSGDLTVADTGLVVAVSDNAGKPGSAVVQRWDDRLLGRERLTDADDEPLATLPGGTRVSPDGRLVAVGSCCTEEAYVVDTTTGKVVTRSALDYEGSLASAGPVGWLDDGTSVWQVMPQGGGGDGSLVLVTDDGRARTVGAVEDAVPEGIAVATDLMTTAHPAVDRAAPGWARTATRLLVLLLVAALLVVGGSAVWSRRRAEPGPAVPFLPRGIVALTAATVGSIALSIGWVWLISTSADETEAADVLLLAGPGALVVIGVALLLHRRWRWVGIGLVAGPPTALLLATALLVMALSEIGS